MGRRGPAGCVLLRLLAVWLWHVLFSAARPCSVGSARRGPSWWRPGHLVVVLVVSPFGPLWSPVSLSFCSCRRCPAFCRDLCGQQVAGYCIRQRRQHVCLLAYSLKNGLRASVFHRAQDCASWQCRHHVASVCRCG